MATFTMKFSELGYSTTPWGRGQSTIVKFNDSIINPSAKWKSEEIESVDGLLSYLATSGRQIYLLTQFDATGRILLQRMVMGLANLDTFVILASFGAGHTDYSVSFVGAQLVSSIPVPMLNGALCSSSLIRFDYTR